MNIEEDSLDFTTESVKTSSNLDSSSDSDSDTNTSLDSDQSLTDSDWISKNCDNESPVTLSKYTPDDRVIKLYVRRSGSTFSPSTCVSRAELEETIVADGKMESEGDVPSYIQCIYTPTDNTVGYGSKPTFRLVVRIIGPNIFVTIGSFKRLLESREIDWYAVDLFGGKKRRIGNLFGSFGASLNHGQVPGFRVYKLFTRKEIEQGVTAVETLDDYILFPEQTMLLPFVNGHGGVGGVRSFVGTVVNTLVGIDYEEFLTEFKVDYKDPDNMIYMLSGISQDTVLKPDGSFDLSKVFELYDKYNGLSEINCADLGVTSVPIYKNLKTLVCALNHISEIGDYPNLVSLVCYGNDITRIGNCPNLRELHANDNELTELIEYPLLESLMCRQNNLRGTLPKYPVLKRLDCSDNKISKIPVTPELLSLTCSDNLLTELGGYPELIHLDCSNNLLSRIGTTRFSNVTVLNCENNRLMDLPFFRNLRKLDCTGNQLMFLKGYPKLSELKCADNELTQLPMLPRLQVLDCRNNKLTSIPEFPNLKCIDYDKDILAAPHLAHLNSCQNENEELVIT